MLKNKMALLLLKISDTFLRDRGGLSLSVVAILWILKPQLNRMFFMANS